MARVNVPDYRKAWEVFFEVCAFGAVVAVTAVPSCALAKNNGTNAHFTFFIYSRRRPCGGSVFPGWRRWFVSAPTPDGATEHGYSVVVFRGAGDTFQASMVTALWYSEARVIPSKHTVMWWRHGYA